MRSNVWNNLLVSRAQRVYPSRRSSHGWAMLMFHVFVGQVPTCVKRERSQAGEDFQVVAAAGLFQVGGGAFDFGQGQRVADPQ